MTEPLSEESADAVDRILGQWHRERPDLPNTQVMATVGRIRRCAAILQPLLEKTFTEYNLSSWEFDVLATLLRSGSPYSLTPTELFSALMITSGTMTHRLQQLEKRQLISRTNNPNDARSKLVQLTDTGFELINCAVEAHLANEQKILSGLSKAELKKIDDALRLLMSTLENACKKN